VKYLFFDCECANCYDHQGKICSFGYLITDPVFNVLEKKDLIMNPDAPFDPHVLGIGENSINLAYTPVRFKYAPKFDAFYPTLVSLLTDKDTIVFGYAVENDIGFLYSECHRYQKTMPDFVFYDIQEIYRIYREWDRSPSLEDALKDLNVPFDSYAEHQSSDDAEMSMLLLKEMGREIGQTAEELAQSYPTCRGTTPTFMIQAKLAELPQRDLGFPYDAESRENSRTFNQLIHYVDSEVKNRDLQGRRFLFSRLAKQDIATAVHLANAIIDRSGETVRYLKEATDYVVYDEQEKTEIHDILAPLPLRLLSIKELENLLK
jgi:DNA polymerase III epsilon subunit-like protein